jgi:hypothetical protein
VRRFILIIFIAWVAAAAEGRAGPTAPAPVTAAAKIAVLLHDSTASAEIVRFTDPREAPVRIVRGRGRSVPIKPALDVQRGGATPSAAPGIAAERLRAAPASSTPEVVIFAGGDPVTILRGTVAAVARDLPSAAPGADFGLYGAPGGADLDRVAFAVDGAESSHGADPGMWRPELGGPQGPMQVSAAAAIDSGDGDRFDMAANRQLGRAYLALLFGRYGNWADAVTAYNWGPGNLDEWIAEGRPAAELPLGVERYRDRVLRDGGIRPGNALSPAGR